MAKSAPLDDYRSVEPSTPPMHGFTAQPMAMPLKSYLVGIIEMMPLMASILGTRSSEDSARPEADQAIVSNVQSHSANPASVSQIAALESILGNQDSVPQMIAEYERRRRYVVERLNGMAGLSCANPGGAFYAFPNISSYFGSEVRDSVEFSTWLLRQSGVAVVPGSAFGMEGHVRISFATSMENLVTGMDLMEDALAKM